MLSSTAEYALKAVLYLAAHTADQPVRVSDVAAALAIPRNYLAKIMHELARSGVLVSARGKHGGFQLGIAPEALSLLAVVERFDRIAEERSCLLVGGTRCSDRYACAAHWRWKAVSEQIATFFRETTVADLMQGSTRGSCRHAGEAGAAEGADGAGAAGEDGGGKRRANHRADSWRPRA